MLWKGGGQHLESCFYGWMPYLDLSHETYGAVIINRRLLFRGHLVCRRGADEGIGLARIRSDELWECGLLLLNR